MTRYHLMMVLVRMDSDTDHHKWRFFSLARYHSPWFVFFSLLFALCPKDIDARAWGLSFKIRID